jgi:hypothetical protein
MAETGNHFILHLRPSDKQNLLLHGQVLMQNSVLQTSDRTCMHVYESFC